MDVVVKNLRVEIKPREDGKPGYVGLAVYNRATALAFGKTCDEVATALIQRLGDLIAAGCSR